MNKLLGQLGSAVGIPGLCVDEKGVCSISVDGEVFTLRHEPDTEECYFVHQLTSLPRDAAGQLALYAFLLERNCCFRGTGPGLIGISREDNAVLYCARLAVADIAYQDFERFLQGVVDTCAHLRKAMADASPPAPPETAEPVDFNTMIHV